VIDPADRTWLDRVHALALHAESEGNLPIAAVVVHRGELVAASPNRSLEPTVHPGRHAEVEALREVPEELFASPGELTVYASLEPCLMCFGALVLHRVGRVVFGARDPKGGAVGLLPYLPAYVRAKAEAIDWRGPVDPDRFDPLATRALGLAPAPTEAAP